MHFTQLRAFHAVALHGGFTRAAHELNLTQPAISDQVRKLEQHFDVRLFERGRGSVQPTPLGAALFEITRRLFEVEEEAVELLSESRALRFGHLKLAADAPLHGIRLIGAFKRQYPGITISLRVGNTRWVSRQLRHNMADLGILADAPEDVHFSRLVLRDDPLVAFVAVDHHFSSKKAITLKKLVSEPFVMREQGSVTRAMVEAELQRLGLDYHLAMEAEGREAVREAVAAGIGVGIVSQPEFGFDPRLHAIQLTDCRARMTECLICLKDRLRLRGVRAFWQVAENYVSDGAKD